MFCNTSCNGMVDRTDRTVIEKGKSIKRSICLYCKPLLSTVEYPVVYDNTDPVLLPDRIYPGTCKKYESGKSVCLCYCIRWSERFS